MLSTEQSFDALRAALMSAPVLRVWDPSRPTRLTTDASELAVSGILEQPDDGGAFHPIAFESRKLTAPERAYPPHLLELLAVVHCLKSFRPYLLDRTFELRTDNASLQWFLQQRSLSHHQARWLNTISEFKCTVVQIPGRLNPARIICLACASRRASPPRHPRGTTTVPRSCSTWPRIHLAPGQLSRMWARLLRVHGFSTRTSPLPWPPPCPGTAFWLPLRFRLSSNLGTFSTNSDAPSR